MESMDNFLLPNSKAVKIEGVKIEVINNGRLIVALNKTGRLMNEIDKVEIEE